MNNQDKNLIEDFDIKDKDIRVFKIGKRVCIQKLSESPVTKWTVDQNTEKDVFKYVELLNIAEVQTTHNLRLSPTV